MSEPSDNSVSREYPTRPFVDERGSVATDIGSIPSTVSPPSLLISGGEQALGPLLTRRLRFVACLASAGLSIAILQRVSTLSDTLATTIDRQILYSCAGAFALELPICLALFRRRFGIRQLRRFELIVFGGLLLQAAGQAFAPMPQQAVNREFGNTWALAFIIQWVVVIVLYGVLIPNTLRRSLWVVGLMVAIALGVQIAAWSRYPLPDRTWNLWISSSVLYLGVAAGFAIFNSARLETYRRAVETARELGQYKLGRKLGGGGMGEVYLADHKHLKRPCAIKLIRAEKATDWTFVRRFEREVQATTTLTHPAIVQVYDYGQAQDGTCYYVMEYLPGMTLDEIVLSTGQFAPERVVRILKQICGALSEAHGRGLLHRDLKPSNIMLCQFDGRSDVAKLLDFGLVTELGEVADTKLTLAGGILGTPAYMSPEQARGIGELGPASDLYSLGAVAYFLIAGRPPFFGDNALSLLHSHQAVLPEPASVHAPGLPADLESVIMRLLAKDPKGRFATAIELATALEDCECAKALNSSC